MRRRGLGWLRRGLPVLALLVANPAQASGSESAYGPLRWAAKAAKASKAGSAAKLAGSAKLATGAKAIVAGGAAYAVARGGRVFGRLPDGLADGALFVTRSPDGSFLGFSRGAREARSVDDLSFAAGTPPQRVLMDPGVALDRAAVDDLAGMELHVVDGAGNARPVRRADDAEHWVVELEERGGDVKDLLEFAADAVAEGYEDPEAQAPWVLPLVSCSGDAREELDWRVPEDTAMNREGARTWLSSTGPQRVLVIAESGEDLDPLLTLAAERGHRMILAQFDDPCSVGVGTIAERVESTIASPMPLRDSATLTDVRVLASAPLATVGTVAAEPALAGLRRVGWTFPDATAALDEGRPIEMQWWAIAITGIVFLLFTWFTVVVPIRWIIRKARALMDPDPSAA